MNFEDLYSDPPRIGVELAVPAAAQHCRETLFAKPLPHMVKTEKQAVTPFMQPPAKLSAQPVGSA